MKKIYLIILILIIGITTNAKASTPPYIWTIDNGNKNLREDVTTITDTAFLERKEGPESGEFKIYVLKLNNYHGSGIELECRGTGQSGMHFIIELTGKNVINDNNIGINYDYSPDFEFTGNGSLIINAPIPISNKEYKNLFTIGDVTPEEIEKSVNDVDSMEESSKDENVPEEVEKNTVKDKAEDEDEENLIAEQREKEARDSEKKDKIIIYTCLGAFVVLILFIVLRILKQNKIKKEKELKED